MENKKKITLKDIAIWMNAGSRIILGLFCVGCSIAAWVKDPEILYILILPFLAIGGIRQIIRGVKSVVNYKKFGFSVENAENIRKERVDLSNEADIAAKFSDAENITMKLDESNINNNNNNPYAY